MCGIVGHLGPQNSIDIVLEGLRRLEYRGYDSAGVSFVNKDSILESYKKSGKLENLRSLLSLSKLSARTCIGHTRWATHGLVNDINSHPHSNNEVAVVHNGIIENASLLKEELLGLGVEFKSETDSEVFLALVSFYLKEKNSFFDSVKKSFERVEGNSAFVVLFHKTAEILAVKKGAPLVCGINDSYSDAMISSDPYALIGHSTKLYFPEDGVFCSLSSGNLNLINFLEKDGEASKRYLSKSQEMGLDATDKGNYEHFMLKEIFEQPELIRSLTSFYFTGEGQEALSRATKLKPNKVHIIACGTAYYAGLLIRDYLERLNKIPALMELASEFRYREPLLEKKDWAIFVSQSGETADTLAAQYLCKGSGVTSLSIVNTEGSTLYRECDYNLLIRAGREIGVASTKAFTQQVLTGRLYSASLNNEVSTKEGKMRLAKKFSLLAQRVDHLLAEVGKIEQIAKLIYNYKGYFYTGRGIYYPAALEGALKLKEIAYVHAEGYAAGELKHGPLALIDEKMVNIAIVGPELLEKTISNIQEIKTRRGVIVIIGPEDCSELSDISDHFIALNFKGLDELAPLFVNVANQLLAYYMAKFKGTDIDKPRNLAKSVTVE